MVPTNTSILEVLRRPVEPALRAVIGMTDRLVPRRPAPPDGHLQGVDDELGADVIGDGPAHDPSAPRIDDDRDIDLALASRVFCDVADPEAIRPIDAELAVDQVIGGDRLGITARAAVISPLVDAGDARRPQEPLDALAADADALAETKLVVDARCAIAAPGHLMDGHDLLGQLRVASPTLTRVGLALAPLIEPRRRDAEDATQHGDGVVGLLHLDELEAQLGRWPFSVAKKAAAFPRISFSMRNTRFSRRSLTSSTRSSLVRPSRRPSSTSDRASQLRRQLSLMPRSLAIWPIDEVPSRANSMARWRNSGGCGRGMRTPSRGVPPQCRCPEKRGMLKPAVLHGGVTKTARRAITEDLANLTPGEGRLLLATASLLGEGFDCPALDTLFLAFPIRFKGSVVQCVGRVLRPAETKTRVEVHDYVDVGVPVLARMHDERRKAYASLGFDVPKVRRPSSDHVPDQNE
jgi:hypothetical protein